MTSWGFLSNHARVLPCIARDPGARLRDIAASLGITERSAHGILTDLAETGYVARQKDGRRNRYRIQAYLPAPEPGTRRDPRPVRSPGPARTPAGRRHTHPQSRNGQSAAEPPAGAPGG
jgi:hypothetical protein